MSNGKFGPGRPPATEFMAPPPGVTVEMPPEVEELDEIELLPEEPEETKAPPSKPQQPKTHEAKAGIGAALDPEMPRSVEGFW